MCPQIAGLKGDPHQNYLFKFSKRTFVHAARAAPPRCCSLWRLFLFLLLDGFDVVGLPGALEEVEAGCFGDGDDPKTFPSSLLGCSSLLERPENEGHNLPLAKVSKKNLSFLGLCPK